MGDRSAWAELSSEFRRQHFLVGLALANLYQVRSSASRHGLESSVAVL
jgi:hypothetical protein